MVAGPGTISNTSGTFIVDKNVDLAVYNKGNYVDSDKAVESGRRTEWRGAWHRYGAA